MSPILGIFASQGRVAANSYESIATATPSGVSSFSFTSIPSTYKHLQVRGLVFTSAATNPEYSFNGSGSGYNGHHLFGNGSSAFSNAYFAYNYNPSASYPSVFIMDILDYTNTNKYKVTRTLAGCDTNGGTSEIALWSGLWQNTAAINQITFTGAGANYASGSHFALYGIKGA